MHFSTSTSLSRRCNEEGSKELWRKWRDLCFKIPRKPGRSEMKQEIPTSSSSTVFIAMRILHKWWSTTSG